MCSTNLKQRQVVSQIRSFASMASKHPLRPTQVQLNEMWSKLMSIIEYVHIFNRPQAFKIALNYKKDKKL